MAVEPSEIFLATTANEDFWETGLPVVFLSDWCCAHSRRKYWSARNARVARSPWDSLDKRLFAARYADAVYELLLPKLAHSLNKIHQAAHGVRYWRIVAGPWLHMFVSVLYDRYARMKLALEDFPGLITIGLDPTCFATPADSMDFPRYLVEDSYNLQLFTRILDALGLDFPRLRTTVTSTPLAAAPSTGWKEFLKPAVAACLWWLARTFPRKSKVVLKQSFFSRSEEFRFTVGTQGAVWPDISTAPVLPEVPVNPGMRAQLQLKVNEADEFLTILLNSLPHETPKCLVENYTWIRSLSDAHYNLRPRAIFSANSWYYDEAFKHWAASCAESGTDLLCAQHGGAYGHLEYMPSETHEIEISDRYYSWGWTDSSANGKVVAALPASKLSAIPPMRADNRRSGILYVATAEPRYQRSFQNLPEDMVSYIAWQQRFLERLRGPARQALRTRLFAEDYGWDIAARWSEFAPEVPLETNATPFLASLANCRLLACDHLGTTFFEAMAANKPAIMFFDASYVPLREAARPYYESLRRAGIFHENPEGAAAAVAAAYDDIEAWWNDAERQSARTAFCEHYAKTSPQSFRLWANEFARIAKAPKPSQSASRNP
jgi:putative transferase (TIGR04331 family)